LSDRPGEAPRSDVTSSPGEPDTQLLSPILKLKSFDDGQPSDLSPIPGSPEARVFGLFGLWRAGCATGDMQQDRGLLPNPAMGSVLVIVSAPIV
jgi:hypothetical protein